MLIKNPHSRMIDGKYNSLYRRWYYEQNKEHDLKLSRAYYEQNKEHYHTLKKSYYEKHKPEYDARRKKRAKLKPVELLVYQREWSKKNPKKRLSYSLKQLNNINDHYNFKSFEFKIHFRNTKNIILKRDNYECNLCKSNHKLEVHHILRRKYYPEFALDETNLITLCKECHDNITFGKWNK